MIKPLLPALPAEAFGLVAELVLLAGSAALFAWKTLVGTGLLEKRSGWPGACAALAALAAAGAFPVFGTLEGAARAAVFFLILLYASVSDVRTREVPDFAWVMIVVLALAGPREAGTASMLAGAAAVFLPQLLLAAAVPAKAQGGADMKLSGACAFLLGAEKGIPAFICGMLLACAVTGALCALGRADRNRPFPLVPYLAAASYAAFLI